MRGREFIIYFLSYINSIQSFPFISLRLYFRNGKMEIPNKPRVKFLLGLLGVKENAHRAPFQLNEDIVTTTRRQPSLYACLDSK